MISTDSFAQLSGYPPYLFAAHSVAGLGAILVGTATTRTGHDDVTLFCSVGLAGTEVALAAPLCEAARNRVA